MPVTSFSAKLESGEEVTFVVSGEGPRICYIIGPGSFYLSGIAKLDKDVTFVTCDGLWTRDKKDTIDEKAIRVVTAESIMQHEKLVINKIKSQFKCGKIGLMGFSAPAALAFKYALENPDDIACVIGTGSGLCELDPSFTATNAMFKQKASPDRVKRFEMDFKNYENIKNDEKDGVPLPTSNFAVIPPLKRRLTPNSDYLEQIRFLTTKLVFNDKYAGDCLTHWQQNPWGHVICQPMREHFFNTIQPKLDTLKFLKELESAGKVPVLLQHGEDDFITPLDEKIKSQLEKYTNVTLKVHAECGHLTYIEKAEEYAKDLRQFISRYIEPCKVVIRDVNLQNAVLANAMNKSP